MAKDWWRRVLSASPGVLILSRMAKRELRTRFPGALLSRGSVLPTGRIVIGHGTYGRPTVRLFRESDSVTIGRFCSIGEDVLFIAGGEHDLNRPSLYPFGSIVMGRDIDASSKGPIEIGHDVWIGARATILSGVNIGISAVIGAGAVVTRDVPNFGIAAGNLARVLRLRFNEEQREALTEIAWWAWAPETVEERREDFYLAIDDFVNKYRLESGR